MLDEQFRQVTPAVEGVGDAIRRLVHDQNDWLKRAEAQPPATVDGGGQAAEQPVVVPARLSRGGEGFGQFVIGQAG